MGSKKSSAKIDQIDLTQFKRTMAQGQREELLETLQDRFNSHMDRHEGLVWTEIKEKLQADIDKLRALYAMEITGGEPDVVGQDPSTGEFIFYDCSPESPDGRRSICYDGDAQKEREKKGIYPAGNAIDMAAAMGIEILSEEQYRQLQDLGEFDTKTSSWIRTPSDIRELDGAIFADYRYGHVFIYHNSAKSFYSARGFRGAVSV